MIPSLSQDTITEYASDAITIQEPTGADYSQGVKVGKTIPAKWWNWLFRAATKRLGQAKTDAQNMLTELQNVVTDAGITLDGNDATQLRQAVALDTRASIAQYITTKLDYFKLWAAAATSGLLPVPASDGEHDTYWKLERIEKVGDIYFAINRTKQWTGSRYAYRGAVASSDDLVHWHLSYEYDFENIQMGAIQGSESYWIIVAGYTDNDAGFYYDSSATGLSWHTNPSRWYGYKSSLPANGIGLSYLHGVDGIGIVVSDATNPANTREYLTNGSYYGTQVSQMLGCPLDGHSKLAVDSAHGIDTHNWPWALVCAYLKYYDTNNGRYMLSQVFNTYNGRSFMAQFSDGSFLGAETGGVNCVTVSALGARVSHPEWEYVKALATDKVVIYNTTEGRAYVYSGLNQPLIPLPTALVSSDCIVHFVDAYYCVIDNGSSYELQRSVDLSSWYYVSQLPQGVTAPVKLNALTAASALTCNQYCSVDYGANWFETKDVTGTESVVLTDFIIRKDMEYICLGSKPSQPEVAQIPMSTARESVNRVNNFTLILR